MTQEDKAKAYDEAIIKAKALYGQPLVDNTLLETILPELKVSEDERIRKALIEMVHDTTGDELWIDYNVHKEEAIAWLEKQGEQKPIDKVEPKFHEGEWVTNGRYNKLIVGINSDWSYYMFKDGTSKRIKDIDKEYHLWTIQDEKDGDIK
jgi:hypothetical protein